LSLKETRIRLAARWLALLDAWPRRLTTLGAAFHRGRRAEAWRPERTSWREPA